MESNSPSLRALQELRLWVGVQGAFLPMPCMNHTGEPCTGGRDPQEGGGFLRNTFEALCLGAG